MTHVSSCSPEIPADSVIKSILELRRLVDNGMMNQRSPKPPFSLWEISLELGQIEMALLEVWGITCASCGGGSVLTCPSQDLQESLEKWTCKCGGRAGQTQLYSRPNLRLSDDPTSPERCGVIGLLSDS